MSTPTKFSVGGLPRTKTGLVPTSFKQTVDELSTPEKWQELPKQPKPMRFRYRGDFVNERNRKLLRERKLARKERQRQHSPESPRSRDHDSCGSTLLVTPQSLSTFNGSATSREMISLTPDNPKKKWDSYCRHISCHKLSAGEQTAKAENKSKFVSYLRSEASKRQERKGSEKDKAKELPQTDAESRVRERKPPVPRLSRLARSGDKENRSNGQKSSAANQSVSKADKPKEPEKASKESNPQKVRYLDFINNKMEQPKSYRTDGSDACASQLNSQKSSAARSQSVSETSKQLETEKTSKESNPPKVRYLDFISNKIDPPRSYNADGKDACGGSDNVSKTSKLRRNALDEETLKDDEEDDDKEDESARFRSQIERIVERAAEMVLHQQQKADGGTADDTDISAEDSSSLLSRLNVNEHEGDASVGGSKSIDLKHPIPEHDKIMTSSVMKENKQEIYGEKCPRRELNDDRANDCSKEDTRCEFSISTFCDEGGSSVIPRLQVEPMDTSLNWQQCRSQPKSLSDFLNDIESTSGTSYISDFDFSTGVSGGVAAIRENSSCVSSFTEITPRMQIQSSQISATHPEQHGSVSHRSSSCSLGVCQEEPVPRGQNFEPSSEPTREQWEEEVPLPRGHDRGHVTIEEEEVPLPRGYTNIEEPKMLDDLFSLLG